MPGCAASVPRRQQVNRGSAGASYGACSCRSPVDLLSGVGARSQAAEVSRAIAARKASMSFSEVSKLHIQRTSFFAASQS